MSSERTVTLSDGSVWEYVRTGGGCVWATVIDGQTAYAIHPRLMNVEPLTASDHRAIADVLDPPSLAVGAPQGEPDVGAVMRGEFTAIGERYDALEIVELRLVSGYADQSGDVQTGYGTALRHLRDFMRRLAPLRFDRDHDANGHLRAFVGGLGGGIGLVETPSPPTSAPRASEPEEKRDVGVDEALESLDRIVGRLVSSNDPASVEAFNALKYLQGRRPALGVPQEEGDK